MGKRKEMLSTTFTAELPQLPQVLALIKKSLVQWGCRPQIVKKIELASEEAIVNIMHYAYPPKKPGKIHISAFQDDKKESVTLVIKDGGKPYNPLKEKVVPNLDQPASERKVGGLGKFFILQLMDDVSYRREDDYNILTLTKFNR